MTDLGPLLEHAEFLERLARSLVDDPSAADDLVQDTWLAALRRPPSAPETARPWLARTLKNLRISRWRQGHARQAREQVRARPESVLPDHELLDRVEEATRVLEAVGRLDEPHRLCILRRYYEDWTARQIAEHDGISIETVKTRLRRARARLREDLDQRYGRDRVQRGLLVVAGGAGGLAPIGTETGPGSTGSGPMGPDLRIESTAPTVGATTGGIIVTLKSIIAPAIILLALALFSWDALRDGAADSTREHAPVAVHDDAEEPPRLAGAPIAPPDPESDAAPGNPPPAATAVRGRVISTTTQQPIAGARVARVEHFRLRPVAETTTNEAGEFQFECEPMERWETLEAVAPGHVVGKVEIHTHVPDTGLDLGVVELEPGIAVVGVVTDVRTDQVVSGAEIWLSSQMGQRLERVATSGRDGRFEVDRHVLARRSVALVAVHDHGYGHTRFVPSDDAETLEVTIPLHDAGQITVRVTDPNGQPIPDQWVSVVPSFEPFSANAQSTRPPMIPGVTARRGSLVAPGPLTLWGKTDSSGNVEFSGLPLELSSPDSRPSGRYTAWAYSERPARLGHVVTPEPQVVVLEIGSRRWVSVSGRVVDDDGFPISGANVRAGSTSTTSDANGRYSIEAPVDKSGYVRVDASHDGYLDRMGRERAVEAEEVTVDVELRLEVQIEGVVTDDHGKPLPGFPLNVRGGGRVMSSRTNDEGRFLIERLHRTEYTIDSRHPDWIWVGPEAVLGGTLDVHGRVEPVPERTAQLIGTVVDHTGAPILIDRASLLHENGKRGPNVSRSLGRIEADGLYAGRWTLSAEVFDFGRVDTTFTIEPGQRQTTIDLVVGASASIELRLDTSALTLKEGKSSVIWLYFDDNGCYWVDESGARNAGVTNNCAFFDPRTTQVVRVANIRTDRGFRVRQVNGWAEAYVDLEPGEHRAVELVIAPPGKVQITRPADELERHLYTRRQPSHPWLERELEWTDQGEQHQATVPIFLGELEWRFEATSPQGDPLVREGSLRVVSREEVVLELR